MKQAYQESPLVTTDTIVDPLESLARLGAQRMLQAALEEEVESYLQRARYERKGVAQGYRSGYLPERSIVLGSGAVPVKVPRVSDEPAGEKFQSRLVKPYQTRSQAVIARRTLCTHTEITCLSFELVASFTLHKTPCD